MKNQTYRMTMLYDFYGEVLTPRQKEFFDLYYNEDLSLAEIADNFGITRQGVRDSIKRGESIILELESKIGFAGRYQAVRQGLSRLEALARDIRFYNAGRYTGSDEIDRAAGEMLRVIGEITE